MDKSTITKVLSTLASGSLTLGCASNQATTEVPAPSPAAQTTSAGEHACGNHAEGACGGDTSSAAPSVRSFEVPTGEFAEANFTMKKGATVSVSFAEGHDELAWDIHSHDHDGGARIHKRGSGGSGTITFTAPEDGVYSALWKNESSAMSPLRVTVTLSDGATIHSWIPTS